MNLFNVKSIATIFAAILLIGATENTRANLITFGFEATITNFGFGSSLTGSYTFNPDADEANPDPGAGTTYPMAIVAMDIAVGSLTASATSPGQIIVDSVNDQYLVRPLIPLMGNQVENITLVEFGFDLFGLDLTSEELPTSPPQNWSFSIATLGFEDLEGRQSSPGSVGSITAIPEPTTVLLVGLALIAGAPIVWRRAHRG